MYIYMEGIHTLVTRGLGEDIMFCNIIAFRIVIILGLSIHEDENLRTTYDGYIVDDYEVGYGALIDTFEWCKFKFASHPLRTTGGSTPVSCDLNTLSVTTTTKWRDFKVTLLTQHAKTLKKYSHG